MWTGVVGVGVAVGVGGGVGHVREGRLGGGGSCKGKTRGKRRDGSG